MCAGDRRRSACSVVLDDVDAAQERLHATGRWSAGRSRRWAARGWSRRSSRPATPATTAPTKIAPALRTRVATVARVAGLDLQVLGGVGVDDPQPGVEVVDQHDARLRAVERGADPLGVLGRRAPARAPAPGRRRPAPRWSVTSTAPASGSCSAWLIRSAATCAGSAVSSARIAISVGPASESMPIRPRSSRLAAVT